MSSVTKKENVSTSTSSSTTSSLIKDKIILQSTPIPKWHSLVVIFTLLIVSYIYLPTTNEMNTIATIQLITNRLFPYYISIYTLGILRGCIALFIWITSLYTIFIGPGMTFSVPYLPGTKLHRVSMKIKGYKTMTPFTCWSWNFLGIYFTLSSYVCLYYSFYNYNNNDNTTTSNEPSKFILRLTLLIWEISSPYTFLVSSIITYVIWPAQYKDTKDTRELQKLNTLLMHNSNVVVAIIDATILGGIPVYSTHFAISPFIGCIYVIFTWCMAMYWFDNNTNDCKKYGPQYIYFFMDPTLPGYQSTIAIIGLVVVCTFSYMFNVMLTQILFLVHGYNIVIHCIMAIILSYPFLKIHD